MYNNGYRDLPDLSNTHFKNLNKEWAWGGSRGSGVEIAVIDSGIDETHPALENCVKENIEVVSIDRGIKIIKSKNNDAFGHGTACAGIIHSIAPEAKIYSIKVLGHNLRSTGDMFLKSIKWVIDKKIPLVNLSLGTTKEKYFAPLHTLVDKAYFNRLIMVAALNNSPVPSFPAVFSSIIGVKAINNKDPFDFYFSNSPPVEFLIKGVDIKLPWLNHKWEICTGNSFAAPHLTGIIALILSKHPYLTPFMVKTILYCIAVKKGEFIRT